MTDQKSDQPGVDGLLPCPFCGSTSSGASQRDNAWRVECSKCGNGTAFHGQRGVAIRYWNTRATRDGAEGAGDIGWHAALAQCADYLIEHGIDAAIAVLVREFIPDPVPAAPPKPAPDAMREALTPFAKIADEYDTVDTQRSRMYKDEGRATGSPMPDSHRVSIAIGQCRKARAALSAPVPPADGVRVSRDVLEAIDAIIDPFESDKRVLYPDSEVLIAFGKIRELISPSGTGAAEPVAWGRPHVEYSASREQSRVEYWVSREDGKVIESSLATSPVRRDREAIAETIHKARWPLDRQMAITPFADEDANGRAYCFWIADAILSLPVKPGAGERGAMPRHGRPAFWTHDDEAAKDVGHLYYFAPTNRSPPPYKIQRHVNAIIDIAADGTLAGVELIDDMPPPPFYQAPPSSSEDSHQ